MMSFYRLISFFFLMAWLVPYGLRADSPSPHVIINEVMWAGGEYIELFNAGSGVADLSGWKIMRERVGQPQDVVTTVASGKSIEAQGYFLLQMSGATTISSDDSLPANKLVDAGELLLLQDQGGVTVDTVNQVGVWFAGKNQNGTTISMERNNPGDSGTDAASWHNATGTGGGRNGTPRAANSEVKTNHIPEAVIGAPVSGFVNQAINFSAEDSIDEDGDALTYSWNFGDTKTGSGSMVTHTYTTSGNFDVELTVSDGSLNSTATKQITISQPTYSSAVVVNEFLPNPAGTDTNNEFIELLNIGDSPVDLSGWKLDDIEGGSSSYTFPAGTIISGSGFLSFYNSASHITLNNDADSARLLAPDGQVKSSNSYASSPGEGQSVNRIVDGTYVLSTTLTPNAANIITAPPGSAPPTETDAIYSRSIKINEVLPNPEGSDTSGEFIELKNIGDNMVSMTNWKLDDGDGGSSPYLIPLDTNIEAGKLLVFFSSDTHLSLSNTGDTVRLLDPNSEVADSFSYTLSHEGASHNRQGDNEFKESGTITPGVENIITALSSSVSSAQKAKTGSRSAQGKVAGTSASFVNIEQLKNHKDGELLITQGVVSAPINLLGAGVMYMAGSGIRVALPKSFVQVFAVGDIVTITGKLGISRGERRLVVSAKTDVIKKGVGLPPTPHEIKTGEVNKTWEGSLVHVRGRIIKLDGDSISIDDGSGAARIVVVDSTGIHRPRLKQGIVLGIVGVVSPTITGYRVLPRFLSDIIVNEPLRAASTVSPAKVKKIGRITPQAAFTVVPTDTASASPTPVPSKEIMSKKNSPSAFQITPAMVLAACLLAMGFLIRGFHMNEPLLMKG